MEHVPTPSDSIQQLLPFKPGTFMDYVLSREDVKAVWKDYIHNPFVTGIGDGTLPLESFKKYLIQDYLFLVQYARAVCLAAYKAKSAEDMFAGANCVLHIQEEMKLHVEYCKEFGLSVEYMRAADEHPACTAYTRYVLDVGHAEDWLALQVALAPCMIGYRAIGEHLLADPATKRDGNTYWKWIETYAGAEYGAGTKIGAALIEKYVVGQSPQRIEELVKIFIRSVKLETSFWEIGLK